MNFPDIETCRAIGAEFPDSEYVWAAYKDSCVADLENRKYFIMPRSEVRNPKYVEAPAPTCEELGEWLRKNKIDYGWQFLGQDTSFFFMGKHIKSSTETQARAEAVKLILENQ